MKKYFETEWNENNNEFKLVIIKNISRNSIQIDYAASLKTKKLTFKVNYNKLYIE